MLGAEMASEETIENPNPKSFIKKWTTGIELGLEDMFDTELTQSDYNDD